MRNPKLKVLPGGRETQAGGEVHALIGTPGGSEFDYRPDGATFTYLLNEALAREPKGSDRRAQLESLDTMRSIAEEAGVEYPDDLWKRLLNQALSDRPPSGEAWEALHAVGPMWREAYHAGVELDSSFVTEAIDQLLDA